VLSKVYVTVVRPSVRLSVTSTATTAASGFAAECAAAGDIDGQLRARCGRRAAGTGAQQQMWVR